MRQRRRVGFNCGVRNTLRPSSSARATWSSSDPDSGVRFLNTRRDTAMTAVAVKITANAKLKRYVPGRMIKIGNKEKERCGPMRRWRGRASLQRPGRESNARARQPVQVHHAIGLAAE